MDDEGLIGLALGLVVGFVVALILCTSVWHKITIEHGAAEWRIDAKTGNREFAWLTEGEE